MQRHPAKGVPTHADLLRVDKTHKITMNVPLHFINEAGSIGVKKQGGEIQHNISEVEVSCLPQDLPEFIEVDMAEVEMNAIVHLSDLKLPKGVELTQLALGDDHDQPVAAIHAPKVRASEMTTKKAAKKQPARIRRTVAEPVRLIVGLGNPGREYEDTRHNAGVWYIDALLAARAFSLPKTRSTSA